MRDSNFELLRILCIIGIVAMHAASPLFSQHDLFNYSYLLFINAPFNTGVSIFVLISGYFGIKFNPQKIINIWLLVLFYSLVELFVFKLLGSSIKAKDIIHHVTPIYSNHYWFISCYFLLLVFAPCANWVIHHITKKRIEYLLLTLIIWLSIIPTIIGSDVLGNSGKSFPYMLMLYWIGGYIRLYVPKKVSDYRCKLLCIACVSILLVVIGNATLLAITGKYIGLYARDCSILILVASIAIFLLFRNLNIKSVVINHIAQNVLAIYLLNCCMISLVKDYYNPEISASTKYVFIAYPVFTLLVCLSCWFTEELRRYFMMLIQYILKKCGIDYVRWFSNFINSHKKQMFRYYLKTVHRISPLP